MYKLFQYTEESKRQRLYQFMIQNLAKRSNFSEKFASEKSGEEIFKIIS